MTPSPQVQLPRLQEWFHTCEYTSILTERVYYFQHLLVCIRAHGVTNKLGSRTQVYYRFSLLKGKLTFLPFVLFNRERVKKGAPYLQILPTAAAWQIFHNQSVFCTGRRTVLISSASSITISTFRRWQADSSTSTREMERSLYIPDENFLPRMFAKTLKIHPPASLNSIPLV